MVAAPRSWDLRPRGACWTSRPPWPNRRAGAASNGDDRRRRCHPRGASTAEARCWSTWAARSSRFRCPAAAAAMTMMVSQALAQTVSQAPRVPRPPAQTAPAWPPAAWVATTVARAQESVRSMARVRATPVARLRAHQRLRALPTLHRPDRSARASRVSMAQAQAARAQAEPVDWARRLAAARPRWREPGPLRPRGAVVRCLPLDAPHRARERPHGRRDVAAQAPRLRRAPTA